MFGLRGGGEIGPVLSSSGKDVSICVNIRGFISIRRFVLASSRLGVVDPLVALRLSYNLFDVISLVRFKYFYHYTRNIFVTKLIYFIDFLWIYSKSFRILLAILIFLIKKNASLYFISLKTFFKLVNKAFFEDSTSNKDKYKQNNTSSLQLVYIPPNLPLSGLINSFYNLVLLIIALRNL